MYKWDYPVLVAYIYIYVYIYMCAVQKVVFGFSVQCGIRPGAVPSPYNGRCIALCCASRCIMHRAVLCIALRDGRLSM